MNNKIFIVVAIILTSISTGYSVDTTKTTVKGNPLVTQEPNLNPSLVSEILADNAKYESHTVTTEKHTFSIEYKGAESLLNQMSHLLNKKTNQNQND